MVRVRACNQENTGFEDPHTQLTAPEPAKDMAVWAGTTLSHSLSHSCCHFEAVRRA
jgi:hypothetical protein